MARDFSPISFFQRTPNVLLGRYFQDKHGVLKEIAFAQLDESGSTAAIIFEAFSGLPEPQQARIEAECQDIESMVHQAGVTALIDEATDFHKNADFPQAINEQDSFHGKIARLVEEGERQAEIERKRREAEYGRWRREEEARQAAKELKDSKEELLQVNRLAHYALTAAAIAKANAVTVEHVQAALTEAG